MNITAQENERIMKFVQNICPNEEEFLTHVKPFLLNFIIREEYEKFLALLPKLNVNGIEGVIAMMSGMANVCSANSKGLIQGIFNMLRERYNGFTTLPSSFSQFVREYTEELSVEKIIPLMEAANEAMYEEYNKQYRELDEKAELLLEDEKNVYHYFMVLLTKLWINYILINPKQPEQLLKLFLKGYLISYYSGMKALYDIQIFPQELLTYIEAIKIPDEEKWKNRITEPAQEYIPQTIPAFQQEKDIYKILQRYFDVAQHTILLSLLQSGIGKEKLLFKSKSNQLADVFKKLYMSNLIVGCNKEELIDWVCNNFTYKSKEGKYVSFDKKYLNHLISSELKPCKNPIIEVKKGEDGKVTLLSPIRKSGSPL